MPNSEYQELIAFLGRKFEEVDPRLDQMATREARESQPCETRRHIEVVAERMQSQVPLVAEGIAEVSQRLDRRTAEITAKIEQESAETRAMIRLSYAQLQKRIQELESNCASVYRPVSTPDSATCAEPRPERSRRGVLSGAEGPVEASAFGSRKDSAFRISHPALYASFRTLVPPYAPRLAACARWSVRVPQEVKRTA